MVIARGIHCQRDALICERDIIVQVPQPITGMLGGFLGYQVP